MPCASPSKLGARYTSSSSASPAPTIDPLIDTVTDSPVDGSQEGKPYLVPGQNIDGAIVKYYPQEAFSTDPISLANGETLSSSKKFEFDPSDFEKEEVPPPPSYTLESAYRPVLWVISSVSDKTVGQFFRNGIFVLDVFLPK